VATVEEVPNEVNTPGEGTKKKKKKKQQQFIPRDGPLQEGPP